MTYARAAVQFRAHSGHTPSARWVFPPPFLVRVRQPLFSVCRVPAAASSAGRTWTGSCWGRRTGDRCLALSENPEFSWRMHARRNHLRHQAVPWVPRLRGAAKMWGRSTRQCSDGWQPERQVYGQTQRCLHWSTDHVRWQWQSHVQSVEKCVNVECLKVYCMKCKAYIAKNGKRLFK